jgi:hypothetical protein
MMTDIRIKVVVGCKLCVSSEDGQKLYDRILENLFENKKVVLSFNGVTNLTSAFLNAAIGQLYSKFSEESIKTNLKVIDIEDDDKVILKRVVERAKDYFKNSYPYEKAVNNLIGGGND